jgi:signal peptidase I
MSERSELTENQSDGLEKKKAETPTMGQELYQTLQSLVVIILVIIFLFTCVVRVTVVSGSSMENTLHGGDIVVTWSLGYSPKQGDIVVLTKTSFQEESIIKRVIATEGQTVDIDYDTSTVYVDGVALDEPYIKEYMWDIWGGNGLDHVTVPDGCIYVMGDNRNNSSDSRRTDIGIVDTRCVIGRAVMVLFPFADIGLL